VGEFRRVMPINSELPTRQKNAWFMAIPDLFAAAGRPSESFYKLPGVARAVGLVERPESEPA